DAVLDARIAGLVERDADVVGLDVDVDPSARRARPREEHERGDGESGERRPEAGAEGHAPTRPTARGKGPRFRDFTAGTATPGASAARTARRAPRATSRTRPGRPSPSPRASPA